VSAPELTVEAVQAALREAGIPEYDSSDSVPMGWLADVSGGTLCVKVKIHSRLPGAADWRHATFLRTRAALRAARYRTRSDGGMIVVAGVVQSRGPDERS
jgi:hypothetical protein